jgi:hypothetical protein
MHAYLDMCQRTTLHNSKGKRPEGFAYFSPADLLLQHGLWFDQAGSHPHVRRGMVKQCFQNAARVVLRRPVEFRYFEGFAISSVGIPMHHAWLVDNDGRAWDQTWPPGKSGPLVGVHVPTFVLRLHWQTCANTDFLTDYKHQFPAMQVAYDDWMPDLANMLAGLRTSHCHKRPQKAVTQS